MTVPTNVVNYRSCGSCGGRGYYLVPDYSGRFTVPLTRWDPCLACGGQGFVWSTGALEPKP